MARIEAGGDPPAARLPRATAQFAAERADTLPHSGQAAAGRAGYSGAADAVIVDFDLHFTGGELQPHGGARAGPGELAGLLPSATGRRVKYSRESRTVINGPFDEPKTLVAGYWILQVKSMDDAVDWARRAPFDALSRIYPGEYGAHGEIEIRQVFEPESSDAS